jgi:hypothetical protein
MPGFLPSARDLHVDSLLTDYAIGYSQDIASTYVIGAASTLKKVNKQSDYYAVWNKGDFFRSEMDVRVQGARSKGAGFRMSTATYTAINYGLHTTLTDDQRENSDVDIEKAKIRYLVHQAMRKRDKVFAAAAFTTSVWANTDQTGVSTSPSTNQFLQWNDSSSTPLKDILEQIEVVRLACGMKPNVMVIDPNVELNLRRHSDFLGLFQYTSGGLVTLQQIAGVLGIDNIIVGNTIENTANEGATTVMANVFGKGCLLAHIAPTPGDEEPTAVTGFSWSPFDQVSATGIAVDSWYEKPYRATFYEAEMYFDCKVTATDAAVYMASAVA